MNNGISVEKMVLNNINKQIELKTKYSKLLGLDSNDIDIDVVVELGEVIVNPNEYINLESFDKIDILHDKLIENNKDINMELYKSIKYKDFYGDCEVNNRLSLLVKAKDTTLIVKI